MVLSTNAEAFVSIINTEVDRHHVEVISCYQVAVVRVCQAGEFPVAVLIEDSFAHAEFLFSIVCSGVQCCRICSGISDIHIPDSLEFIVERQVGKMSGESPGRTIIEACGSECFCQCSVKCCSGKSLIQFIDTAIDIISDSFENIQTVDIVNAGSLGIRQSEVSIEDCLVVDNAIGLIAVSNCSDLAVVFNSQGLVSQMIVEGCVLEIQCVVIPCLSCCSVADVEDCRLLVCRLSHFGLHCCCILSVSRGQDCNVAALLLVVCLSEFLPLFISLRLEVQQIDSSACSRSSSLSGCSSFCGSSFSRCSSSG